MNAFRQAFTEAGYYGVAAIKRVAFFGLQLTTGMHRLLCLCSMGCYSISKIFSYLE
jgi:hypothetical protein